MRLALIVPLPERAPEVQAGLRQLQDWRRRGHALIVVDGGCRDDGAALASALADRVVRAPHGWSWQANAGACAPEAEHADALVFLPLGVQLPERADCLIARALSNSTSPWGRFDVRFEAPAAAGARPGVHRLAALASALANAGSRLSAICTREQCMFVTRGAFLALEGFAAHDAAADTEFSQRARALGRPIALRPPVLIGARAFGPGALLRATARREAHRLALSLGLPVAVQAWTSAAGA